MHEMSERRAALMDGGAYLLVAVFTVALIVFGWQFRPVEGPSAEGDGYVAKADTLLAGEVPIDAYRPLLYPLLAAGAGLLVGDTFLGAKLVSSLAAGLLALLTYLLGRTCFNREVGLFALLCLMSSAQVVQAGVLAATDMLFTTLATLVLFLAVKVSDGLRMRTLVLLGLAFALTYFTRYTAVALLPAIAVAILLADARPREKLAAAGVFAAAAALFLLPHIGLTLHQFGTPFYNENWKNLAFKLYGDGDWSYFARIPFDGMFATIAHDPQHFAMSAARELYHFATGQLGRVLGNGDLLLTGTLFTALFLLGCYRLVFSPHRHTAVLFSFFVVYVALVAVFYLLKARLVLPAVPIAFLVIGVFVVNVAFPAFVWLGKRPVRSYAPLLGLILVLQGAALGRQMDNFMADHPIGSWKAARQLEQHYGQEISVLSSFRHGHRYVAYRHHYLEDAFGPERDDPELYFRTLEARIVETGAQYLIIDQATLGSRPAALLSGEYPPPYLTPVVSGDGATVYRVDHHRLAAHVGE